MAVPIKMAKAGTTCAQTVYRNAYIPMSPGPRVVYLETVVACIDLRDFTANSVGVILGRATRRINTTGPLPLNKIRRVIPGAECALSLATPLVVRHEAQPRPRH
jgi:hypothetical protein